jgi:hypothetical protein
MLTTHYRPRKATPGELLKAGVEIIAASTFGLRCLSAAGCGHRTYCGAGDCPGTTGDVQA